MRIFPTLFVIVLTILVPEVRADSPLPQCAAGTLASYEASNSNGCVLGKDSGGILVFNPFTFNPIDNATGLDSLILVNPVPQGLGGGFSFSGLAATPGETISFAIDYTYVIDPGPVTSGADMGMDPPFGDVTITEAICADSVFTNTDNGPECTLIGNLGGSAGRPQTFSVNVDNQTNHLDLDPEVINFATVQTTYVLHGDDPDSHFDSLSATFATADPAPEPATLLTVFGGLLAVGLGWRRRSIG